jgi:hypothetical protein
VSRDLKRLRRLRPDDPWLKTMDATPAWKAKPVEKEWEGTGAELTRPACREACPYGLGDVIVVRGAGDCEWHLAMVLHVLIEQREYNQDYIAKMTVVKQTKRGEWANQWTRVYPRDIEAGFERYRAGLELQRKILESP